MVSVDDALILESHSFIEKHNLNATDALILRSALDIASELQPEGDSLVLMTADRRLFRAAESEGLRVLNPEEASLEDVVDFEGEKEA